MTDNLQFSTVPEKAPIDAICWQLQEHITRGVLMPGESVDLELLSQVMSVTREQVMAALVKLARDGLVCIHPNQGIFVARLSISELLSVMEFLAELEGACAKLATQRLTPRDAASLRASCTSADITGDVRRYGKANAAFHETLYRASRNESLTIEIARVRARTQVYRRSPFETPGRALNSRKEHELIMRAVLSGDAGLARDRMVEHMQRGAKDMVHDLSALQQPLLGFDTDYPGRHSWYSERHKSGLNITSAPLADQSGSTNVSFKEIVGARISASIVFNSTLEQVAEELRMSPRTLVRRLGNEGVTFQQIKNEVRRDRAIELIRQNSRSISEIALELGFSDASSFHRAFRAWTGSTPGSQAFLGR